MSQSIRLGLLSLLSILSFVLVACSKPKEPHFLTREQLYMQQLDALNDLAQQKATLVSDTIAVNDYLDTVPIFISLPDQTDFSQYYRQFLLTALTQKGFRVSETQEDLLILSFSLQDRMLLTTQLTFDNRYLMRDTQIFNAGPATLSRAATDAIWQQYSRRKPAYIR